LKYNRIISLSALFTTLLFVAERSYSQIQFIENKGQWDSRATFMSPIGNGKVFLENKGFTVLQHNQKDMDAVRAKMHGELRTGDTPTLHSHAYKVEFLNANPKPIILPDKALPGLSNYFIGNDRTKWGSGCKTYQGVTYKDVYPGIDIRYYADGGGRLKYDIIAYPGSDISKIALKYEGADKLELKDKELLIKTSVGDNKELEPYSYQPSDKGREAVNVKYVLKENIVRFKVRDYDATKVLIIDPTEIFFSYTGSTADNWGFTATYGPKGSFFSGGIVFDVGTFPTSPGAFQSHAGGQYDIGIMELSSDGSQRIYATYIGGSGGDQPQSLISDPQGNLIIAGRTNSLDYPVTGGYGPGGGWDIIVTKLNATGTALIGSMHIGGSGDDGVNIKDKASGTGTLSLNRNYGDDARSEVIIDASDNIYVAACTQSDNFKTSAGAIQSGNKGGPNHQDAVVLKINPNCNTAIWSTLLGGSGDDAAYILALGNNDNIYVAGGTGSIDFIGVTPGVIQPSNKGGACDGFITEISNDGTRVIRGTYLGTAAADQIYGIQADKAGNIYVMGTTEGAWPVVNAAFVNADAKQFIGKLKPDLSSYVYSTTFGSANSTYPNISPTAFLVDRCENVYVSGWGGKSNIGEGYKSGTTRGMPVTAGAIKSQTDASGSDFYFFVMQKNAASQLYGSFFGQDDPPLGSNPQTFGDHVDGGTSRFDKQGVIYQAICANCFKTVSFTGTPGSWSPFNGATEGGLCNLGMIKIEMDFSGVVAAPRPSINGISYDTIGCVPLTLSISDTLLKGKQYIWNFGDGTPNVTTTGPDVQHVYNSIGTFTVMEIAVDSSTCNVTDTAYFQVRVGDNKANMDFVANKLPPCTSLAYSFYNLSTPTRGSFNSKSFKWDFGDGSSQIIIGTDSVTHTYASPGTYIVTLKLLDTLFCNVFDEVHKTLRVSTLLKAMFTTPADGCVPYLATFENTSLGGITFTWDFGDGTTFTGDSPPPHLYTSVGDFIVKLHVTDTVTCNHTSDTSFTIKVHPLPFASFTWLPNPPRDNTITDFTNLSTGAVSYLWNFGDGETSIEVNPKHLYIETGTFNACLTATNEFGCSKDTCIPVQTLITPLLDVPNAFTPGRFGVNSIIKVIGFGVKQMNWNIYNRWGEKIFESHSVRNGWDGTYKGKLQPMDVYTYTLEVTFSDGKKVRRTGDITMLR
jgi:gliding motility-associated-like protein